MCDSVGLSVCPYIIPNYSLHSINKVLTGKIENRLEFITFSLEIYKIPIKQDSAVSLCVRVYKPMLYFTKQIQCDQEFIIFFIMNSWCDCYTIILLFVSHIPFTYWYTG